MPLATPIALALLTLGPAPAAGEGGVTHGFFAAGAETYIRAADGTVTWRYPHASRDGWALPGGNVLLALAKGVVASHHARGEEVRLTEVTPEKKVVWTFRDAKAPGVHHFQILDTNGEPLDGPPPR
jgi:hypothetical protein